MRALIYQSSFVTQARNRCLPFSQAIDDCKKEQQTEGNRKIRIDVAGNQH